MENNQQLQPVAEQKIEDLVPELVLEPYVAEQALAEIKNEEKEDPLASVNAESLTPEELQAVEAFSKKIEIHNQSAILQYGAAAQQKIADFSEAALESIRTKDLGEVGDMLSELVVELRGFSANQESKGFFGFFKKGAKKIAALKASYDKAEVNVEKISNPLEGHQIQLLKDIAMLDEMYKANLIHFKELSMYILAGKKRLEELRKTKLPEAIEKAKRSGLAEDSQVANDLAALYDRFEKKLHDLQLTRAVSIQMAPQIRLIQNNDTLMTEKIQSTLVNTIPLWKSQMVLALGLAHSQEAIKAQREVTDMTNELLRKNAETLKTGTIEAARESERGIIDIETLTATNQMLITTLDEVVKIQNEGRVKRKSAEGELVRIETELKQKLLDIRQG